MRMKRKTLTDDKFRRIQGFVVYCVLLRKDKHTCDALTSTFLAKSHLQNSIVDRLPRYLATKHVELSV